MASPDPEKIGSLHVELEPPHAAKALSAPVTEVAIATLKQGSDRAAFEAMLEALRARAATVPGGLKHRLCSV